ncbi:TIGR03084 family protein OS=Streptomyces microflavus OX=1919 GN=Smic_46440 PE=4 SV=1 [Streptomyces microflavus]
MSDVAAVVYDLREESDELDVLVGVLEPGRWADRTPAEGGRTVAHQIAHLAWTDEVALLAATEPERFGDEVTKALAAPESFVDEAAQALVDAHAHALLARWRDGRQRLDKVLRDAPAGTRIPWYGPPMSVASMASARLMETWAHGQDIADALGATAPRPPGCGTSHGSGCGPGTTPTRYGASPHPRPSSASNSRHRTVS